MADFGDDVGDMLIRHTDDFIRRLHPKQARQLPSRHRS